MLTGRKSGGRAAKRKVGALFWISLMLFGSAILRLGVDAGPAIAREAKKHAETEEKTQRPIPLEEFNPDPSPDDMQNILREFQSREARLKLRERKIEDRAKALEIANKAIERKMAELIEIEDSLKQTLAMADGASEADLARLTSVYEKMKPKEAAVLFEAMDPDFSAGFFARMRPEVAAGILAKLTPEAAYSISAILAGRNALVPKD